MSNTKCWYKDVCQHQDCDVCIRFMEMEELVKSSGLPENRCYPTKLRPDKCDVEAYNRLNDIKDNIKDFVDNGCDIYIAGKSPGNGKTSWAIKLMMKYFDDIWAGNGFRCRGLFIHVPTFLLRLKDFKNYDPELDMIKSLLPVVDLVIWDDIGSTSVSAYDYTQLLTYLDARISNGMSSIYTSNLIDRETLGKSLGSKMASRIMSRYTEVIEFKGGDRR